VESAPAAAKPRKIPPKATIWDSRSLYKGMKILSKISYIRNGPRSRGWGFNVLAALDAVTHELISVTNTTYINALSVCDLLQKIADLRLSGPITLVLDNARYQRCDLVTEKARALGLELLFLPPYSPNLNLIERVWKFVKKECLRSKYFTNFESFSTAISSFTENMTTTHSRELESLLTHRFQSFREKEKIAA